MNESYDVSDELGQLHLKGELASNGYLKEKYDTEKDELVHTLTPKGRAEIVALFKQAKYRQAFMNLAIAEANKFPERKTQIIKGALKKIEEYTEKK